PVPALRYTLSLHDALPIFARSLQRHNLTTAGLSVYVHELGSATPLLSLAADEPRSPASVMKLLPTLAALEELGPANVGSSFMTEDRKSTRLNSSHVEISYA